MTTTNATQTVARKSSFAKMAWPIMTQKFPVAGLVAEDRGLTIRYSFETTELIDESDARDAQCRAGFDDVGYGFWGFMIERTETGYLSNWASATSCG